MRLERDQQFVRRRQRVERQQAEARRTVDQDELVWQFILAQTVGKHLLPADGPDEFHFRRGEVGFGRHDRQVFPDVYGGR